MELDVWTLRTHATDLRDIFSLGTQHLKALFDVDTIILDMVHISGEFVVFNSVCTLWCKVCRKEG